MDELKNFEEGMRQMMGMVKLAHNVMNELDGVRLYHESSMDTLKRVIRQALKTTCPSCRGDGRSFDEECRDCHGKGEIRYDPNEIEVERVMES